MISDDLLTFLKHWEGFRADAYLDVGGVPTIGYGSTRHADGSPVAMGQTISRADAEALLRDQTALFQAGVERLITADLSSNQRDALVSFAYNVGLRALDNSTLRRTVNRDPQDPRVGVQWMRWVYVNGKPNAGLRKRRTAELRWYRE